jgi:hypothetical protein
MITNLLLKSYNKNWFLFFGFVFILTSCRVQKNDEIWFGKLLASTHHITSSKKGLPPIFIPKNSVISIKSISTLDRMFDVNFTYDSMVIANLKVNNFQPDSTFNRMIRRISKLKKKGISYLGTFENDSIYNSINSERFKNSYSVYDMQNIDFSQIDSNGLFLVYTRLIGKHEPSLNLTTQTITGNLSSIKTNAHYEFFLVKNGHAIQYSGFRIGNGEETNLPFHKNNPRLKDLKWVIRQLRKQSLVYYGK